MVAALPCWLSVGVPATAARVPTPSPTACLSGDCGLSALVLTMLLVLLVAMHHALLAASSTSPVDLSLDVSTHRTAEGSLALFAKFYRLDKIEHVKRYFIVYTRFSALCDDVKLLLINVVTHQQNVTYLGCSFEWPNLYMFESNTENLILAKSSVKGAKVRFIDVLIE